MHIQSFVKECSNPIADTLEVPRSCTKPYMSNEMFIFLLALAGFFFKHGLTLIPAWISNYTHYNMWDEITYPFLNFNGATVEV